MSCQRSRKYSHILGAVHSQIELGERRKKNMNRLNGKESKCIDLWLSTLYTVFVCLFANASIKIKSDWAAKRVSHLVNLTTDEQNRHCNSSGEKKTRTANAWLVDTIPNSFRNENVRCKKRGHNFSIIWTSYFVTLEWSKSSYGNFNVL